MSKNLSPSMLPGMVDAKTSPLAVAVAMPPGRAARAVPYAGRAASSGPVYLTVRMLAMSLLLRTAS